MRIITIEEHIPGSPLAEAVVKYAGVDAPYSAYAPGPGLPYAPDPVIFGDVGEKRIADMDKNGISMQILSVASQSALVPKEEANPAIPIFTTALTCGSIPPQERWTASTSRWTKT